MRPRRSIRWRLARPASKTDWLEVALATHYLDSRPETVTDVFSRDLAPVLTVDPGDRVVVHSLDAHGYLERQEFVGDLRPTMFSDRRGHCLCGPIAVRGAIPGMALAVRFIDLRPEAGR